jgi:hypothetical protein
MTGELNTPVQRYQFRVYFPAVGRHQGAAGVERAAAGRIDGVGNFAGYRCPFAAGHLHIRDGLQQQLGIGVQGIDKMRF